MSSELDDLPNKPRHLECLDEDVVEEGIELAWSEEVAARLADIDSGAVKAVPWAEVRARLLSRT